MYTDCYCTQFRRASNTLTRIYDDALRPAGLRITQFSLLRSVGRLGEATMTALSQESALDLTTISRNVKGMIDAGWIDVERSDDGREKILVLTEAGRGRIHAALPYWAQAQARAQSYTKEFVADPASGYLIKIT